ncbi:hypothetical protein F6V25_15335 [Oryzomonas japonica]|uniref:Uncharacterized protein n=1 Tax=Oryzomonas japonica TaxID=2603858 RepID=A0A7J4ZMA3_9BACT|nr:hypothetical protein [Oryzomonas japonica]KAB0663803.1 hypothetical protein F6V25_15335 [Oryzomonas japonica]
MSKRYRANNERIDAINSFGRSIGKRSGFKCEWCGSTEDLRVWDYQPGLSPNMDTLAMLCRHCRELTGEANNDPNELRSIRNALWSNIPAVAEGAATVLARCNEAWARDAINQSYLKNDIIEMLLGKFHIRNK